MFDMQHSFKHQKFNNVTCPYQQFDHYLKCVKTSLALTEQHLEFLSLKEAEQARVSLFMSKCHIVEKKHVTAQFNKSNEFVWETEEIKHLKPKVIIETLKQRKHAFECYRGTQIILGNREHMKTFFWGTGEQFQSFQRNKRTVCFWCLFFFG